MMRVYKKKTFLCIAVFLLLSNIASANEWKTYTNLEINLTCIARHDNILWCGASDGVVAYDIVSGEYTYYGKWDGLYTHPHIYVDTPLPIDHIGVDNDGIVFASWNEGISSFDGDKWTVHSVLRDIIQTQVRIEYASSTVPAMIIGDDGKLYASVASDYNTGTSHSPAMKHAAAIASYDNGEWIKTGSLLSSSGEAPVYRSFDVDSHGNLWFERTGRGIFRYDGTQHAIEPSWLPEHSTDHIAVDGDGNLCLRAGNDWYFHNVDVWRQCRQSETIVWTKKGNQWAPESGEPFIIGNMQNVNGVSGATGEIWFFLDGALYVFRGQSLQRFVMPPLSDPEQGKVINDIVPGDDNELWVATDAALLKYKDGVYSTALKPILLGDDGAHSIAVDENNVKYFGLNTGLSFFDGYTWNEPRIRVPSGIREVAPMIFDSGGRLWFGENNLCRYTGAAMKLYNTSGVADIAIDSDDTVWVLNEQGDLLRFDSGDIDESASYQKYVYESFGTVMRQVIIDGNDIPYVCSATDVYQLNDNGFSRIYTRTGQWESLFVIGVDNDGVVWKTSFHYGLEYYTDAGFRKIDSVPDTLAKHHAVDIVADRTNRLWIAYKDYGIASYNPETHEWQHFNTMNSGLCDDHIRDICVDHDNVLWIVTQTGVSVLRFDHVVNINDSPEIPGVFRLKSPYPNPFNPSTSISFTLATTGHVNISVFNMAGQCVSVLANNVMSAGQHTLVWNASEHAAGVYVCRVNNDSVTRSVKMTLLK